MEDLISELQGFTPRASTSQAPTFALDPALAGPGPSSSAARARRSQGSAYWDEEDEDLYGDDSDETGESEDETDAEEEYAAATQQQATGVKRARQSQGGLLADDGTVVTPSGSAKGKGKATDQDLFALDGEEGGDEELGRLISAIRNSNSTGVGGATALDRVFDRSIADELDAFDPDLMEDLTVGVKGRRRKRKGKTAGRRAAGDIEPSPEVKRLLGQANSAYAEGRLQEAIELLSEVVRIDPIIRVSWYTLATIYEELGEREKAVQCKIVATHLLGKKEASSEWGDLGRECRDVGLLHQAIYCFTQAIKVNKDDVDAMWDRATLLKLSGATNMAIKAFFALLTLLPHDPGVLRELAPMLASTHQFAKASSILLSAFAYYRSLVPHVNRDTVGYLATYGYSDLETLADFLNVQRNWAESVRVIRQGVRWLQGRESETGWDTLEDDREYDEERKIRGGWEKGNTWFEDEPTYELDVRLRSRLGLARLGMGWVEEAARHFDIVLAEDVAQFPELFGAIGEAYYERKMYNEAIDVYMLMAENEETNGPAVWLKVGQCRQAMGDFEEARDCFENIVEEEPGNAEAKLALAKCLEQLGDPSRALTLIKEVIASRGERADSSTTEGARKRRVHRTKEERAAQKSDREAIERERNAEFTMAFLRLQELEGAIEAGDDEAMNQWLEIATGLVDSFRSTKQLFPSDPRKRFTGMIRTHRRKGKRDLEAEADQLADRLQRSIIAEEDNEVEETSFRGLDFDGWVDFILRYCFMLARTDDIELAAEVLLHVREAGVFRQSETRQESLRLGLIACYAHAGMHEQAAQELRYFFHGQPFSNEPVRLLLMLLSKGESAIEAFNLPKQQKFFIRQLKGVQLAATGDQGQDEDGAAGRASSPVAAKKPTRKGKDKERAVEPPAAEDEQAADEVGEDERPVGQASSAFTPTKLNPVFLTTYGLMMNVSQSHQPAIIYLLRAYKLDDKQPLVNLALAAAYLQRAMGRKTDNRQHQIAQAFAFLQQYRKLRGSCQEADFNLARAFHHLGMHAHAVKHYQKLLESAAAQAEQGMAIDGGNDANTGKSQKEDLVKVAAYNLVTLYAMANAPELARIVAQKWLAV
ncbi:transcription factor TFIIIC subunit tfc4 [Rhodotorula toruloides]